MRQIDLVEICKDEEHYRHRDGEMEEEKTLGVPQSAIDSINKQLRISPATLQNAEQMVKFAFNITNPKPGTSGTNEHDFKIQWKPYI